MACAVVEKLQSVCLRLKGAVSSRHSRMAKRQTRSVQIVSLSTPPPPLGSHPMSANDLTSSR